MWRRILAVLACVGLSTVAQAQVNLRFDPSDTTLAVGSACRLSIVIDEPVAIRTIDVTVTYDPAVVQSQGGAAGALFTQSGIFTFQGFEAPTAGRWHGYAVLMGAGLAVHGPGELYYWDFTALANGSTPITSVEVYLATTDGSWFSPVTLAPGVVRVGPQASQVGAELPARAAPLTLRPNPFNPRTEVAVTLPAPGWTTVEVFDARGRRVARLFEGMAEAGPLVASWDGRMDGGRTAPGGNYLFVVTGDRFRASAKGALLK